MPRTSPRIVLALKLGTTIVLSILLLEFLLLVFNDTVFHSSFVIYDREMGFLVRPYARQSNRFGFNDRDYPLEPAPGTYRIAILGDSFNWVGSRTWNYTRLLQEQLSEYSSDPRIEVLNTGYPATHTAEQLPLLKRFVLQHNPRLLILGFFVGNDFVEAYPWRRRIAFGGATTDIDLREGKEWVLWKQPLLLRSRAMLLIRNRILEYQNRGKGPQASLEMSKQQYLKLEFGRMQFANLNRSEGFEARQDHILNSLREMKIACIEQGVEFIVAAFPDEFQVDPSLREAVWHDYGENPEDYRIDRAQRLLEEFCAREKIDFWDLLPVFAEAHQVGQKLYLPNNSHWNRDGNRLAARELFSKVVTRLENSGRENRASP